MRLLIEVDYSESLLTGELTNEETTIMLRALDKAFFVKTNRYDTSAQLEPLPKNLDVRVVTSCSPILPKFGLRELCKEALAEEAAKDTGLIIE